LLINGARVMCEWLPGGDCYDREGVPEAQFGGPQEAPPLVVGAPCECSDDRGCFEPVPLEYSIG
jgi:hypothetical protein